MGNKVLKLLKTWAYSVTAACCATAFSSIGNQCRLEAPAPCDNWSYGVIGCTVAAFVICFLMFAMWLVADDAAAGVSGVASIATILLLLVAVGLSSRAGKSPSKYTFYPDLTFLIFVQVIWSLLERFLLLWLFHCCLRCMH